MSAYEKRINRRSDYVSLLSRMAQLLAENGDYHQAGILRDLAARIANGQSLSVLDTNDVWGGAGSVVDCSFLHGANPPDEAIANQHRFGELVVQLVDLLEQDGVATDVMRSRRKSYLLWKAQRQQKTAGT
ncbi:MAG: hypothetical protein RMN51_08515 [Verrucomicrobiota bacterium]|nr:hypothetical protein [Limisphaera sp.]MDW8382132.1 hypothetical protein [Verrucomicrobiota bacterium]